MLYVDEFEKKRKKELEGVLGTLDELRAKVQSMVDRYQVAEPAKQPLLPPRKFVGTNGQKFTVKGRDLRFVGFNIRGLLHYGDHRLLPHSHPSHAEIQLQQAGMVGAKVVRAFAANRHESAWAVGERLEIALSQMKRHDMYLIISFTDVHHDTGFYVQGDGPYYQDNRLNEVWFEDGYKRNYLSFVEHLVGRFKDHPRVFAWELGNELKAWAPGVVLPDLFIRFAEDVSNRIRAIDPNHLITTGIINTGNLACNPEQARQLYSLPNLDFMTVHVYYSEQYMNEWMSLEAKRAETDADLARQLNMPFIVEEIGFQGGDRVAQTRYHLQKWFDQKQAAGFMQWGFMATNQDIGDGDNKFGLHWQHPDYGRVVQCFSERAAMCAV